ncbi:unnamed protein product [Durusdinium trenchii]|uniref:Uncharacterized protein n=1 Tax=Durusdinium trenchii TaxID=1381693 RepID=A0ABP0PI51_9DINO
MGLEDRRLKNMSLPICLEVLVKLNQSMIQEDLDGKEPTSWGSTYLQGGMGHGRHDSRPGAVDSPRGAAQLELSTPEATKGRRRRRGQSLQSTRRALLGGRGFAAPPTFLVSSTKDRASPPKQHTDLYAAALRKKRIHCTYLRRNFGPHGFGMSGGWTQECLAWLHQQGFGPDAMQ